MLNKMNNYQFESYYDMPLFKRIVTCAYYMLFNMFNPSLIFITIIYLIMYGLQSDIKILFIITHNFVLFVYFTVYNAYVFGLMCSIEQSAIDVFINIKIQHSKYLLYVINTWLNGIANLCVIVIIMYLMCFNQINGIMYCILICRSLIHICQFIFHLAIRLYGKLKRNGNQIGYESEMDDLEV